MPQLECRICNTSFYRKQKVQHCSKKCYDSYRKSEEYLNQCKINGKKGGKMASKVKRSKNEIIFSNMCIKYFGKNNVLTNPRMFNGFDADVVIQTRKIAIEWNGLWHYKKVRKDHKFEQTKARDKLKSKYIRSKGYHLIKIKDIRSFRKNTAKVAFEKILDIIEKDVLSKISIDEMIEIDAELLEYNVQKVGSFNPENFEKKRIKRCMDKVHKDIKIHYILNIFLREGKSYKEISNITGHSTQYIAKKAREFNINNSHLYKNHTNRIKKPVLYADLYNLVHVQKLPFTKIGKLYGVSDNAIRKRCRKMGISTKR